MSRHIRLVTDVPVHGKPYLVLYSVRKSLQTDIHKMIEMKVIRHSECRLGQSRGSATTPTIFLSRSLDDGD